MTIIGGIAGILSAVTLVLSVIATVILFGLFFYEVPILAVACAVLLALRLYRTRRLRDSVIRPLTSDELALRDFRMAQAVADAQRRAEAAKPTSLD